MKDKIFNTLIVTISLFVFIALIVSKSIIYDSIMYALNMWVNNLIPALFPFFIISDILINYNITDYIPQNIKKICKYIFNINDASLTIFILSMLSGFPSNARNTRTLYDAGMIGADEANHILMFSHFANPVFIMTTVGLFFFSNKKIGIFLLVIHYLSNFILGICVRNVHQHDEQIVVQKKGQNFGKIFISSIRKAIDTTITICGIITVFLLLASIIINYFKISLYNQMIIKGLFEITIGLDALSKLSLGMNYKLIIASMFLAFGGISVHIQVLSQIVDTDIKYQYFLVGRIYQTVIAGILAFFSILLLGI